jgi:hypothetical protein
MSTLTYEGAIQRLVVFLAMVPLNFQGPAFQERLRASRALENGNLAEAETTLTTLATHLNSETETWDVWKAEPEWRLELFLEALGVVSSYQKGYTDELRVVGAIGSERTRGNQRTESDEGT